MTRRRASGDGGTQSVRELPMLGEGFCHDTASISVDAAAIGAEFGPSVQVRCQWRGRRGTGEKLSVRGRPLSVV
eukprot:6187124-Pleurochrysis_carterae.AAC.3